MWWISDDYLRVTVGLADPSPGGASVALGFGNPFVRKIQIWRSTNRINSTTTFNRQSILHWVGKKSLRGALYFRARKVEREIFFMRTNQRLQIEDRKQGTGKILCLHLGIALWLSFCMGIRTSVRSFSPHKNTRTKVHSPVWPVKIRKSLLYHHKVK